ncbi:MAG TPA: xanthine dehydrogenase family protein molybdopterin-binding subunit [Candidatus Limnocylindrales bacterium]|nr:xanthine dehydrogenase family protein molybdopterin-binding subunit [Candidatus Limnocylindrales bacterium]
MRSAQVSERVTGRTDFIDDLTFDGMLHGRFVRIAAAHARILGIDASAAARLPGVVAIFEAGDLTVSGIAPRYGPIVRDQPVLASGTTRYEGEPVALVVAETEEVAAEAARQVEVRFEVLEPILTVEDAMSRALLHDPADRPPEQEGWKQTNVMGEWNFGWGDVDCGVAESTFTIEARYATPFAHHFAIETHGCIGIPTTDGVRILSSAQHPFIHRRVLAEMLGLPLDAVQVVSSPMGGSFGSKGYPKVEPAAALVAHLLQRPVKIALTAEEAFATAQREASVVTARSGFDADGRLVFQDMAIDFLVGAYADISPRVVAKSGLHALAPYHTPNARIRARGIFTTTPPTTAFRGFGAVHTAFALEGQMDRAAAAMGRDPVELRLQNMRAKGARSAYGETPVDGDWPALLRMAATGLGRDLQRPDGVGTGVAMGIKTCIPATTSTARVRLRQDGTAVVEVGTSEMGQGTPALMADLAATRMGLGQAQVTVLAGDTFSVPSDALTASSRSAVHMGNAVLSACDALLARLAEGERALPGQDLVAEGSFAAASDDGHPLGGPTPFYEAVATGVEVRIDRETGHLSIDRVVHATDAGKVLDRQRATGLDEGGLVMGLGLATAEQLIHADDGRLLNGSSLDYRIPTIGDRPAHMLSLFQENGDGPGPSGSKGLAEGGILAIAPALAAAIHDATGVFFDELPITPERIWRALQAQSDR